MNSRKHVFVHSYDEGIRRVRVSVLCIRTVVCAGKACNPDNTCKTYRLKNFTDIERQICAAD